MKASALTNWFSSKWLIVLVGTVLGFLASSVFDQVIRNRVDEQCTHTR